MRRGLVSLTRPLRFAAESAPTETKLKLNFYMPRATVCLEKKVHQVDIPGEAGEFGVLAHHVPIVAAMKPGVLTIYDEPTVTRKYFVSGGFALVHKNNVADIAAIEAVELSELDPEAVSNQLQKWRDKVAQARTPEEKAQAELAVEVMSSMNDALVSGSK